MEKKTLVGYAHAFLCAANEHAQAARDKGVDGSVDGMMCIIAVQNAASAASKVLGYGHIAVRAHLDANPDLKSVRDMLTHVDDYALGTGRLQKPAAVDNDQDFAWIPMWNSPETLLIRVRRQGENEGKDYRVRTRDAVISTAHLVATAVEHVHGTRSTLLDQLTGVSTCTSTRQQTASSLTVRDPSMSNATNDSPGTSGAALSRVEGKAAHVHQHVPEEHRRLLISTIDDALAQIALRSDVPAEIRARFEEVRVEATDPAATKSSLRETAVLASIAAATAGVVELAADLLKDVGHLLT